MLASSAWGKALEEKERAHSARVEKARKGKAADK
jgi:hypothetical protein